MNNRNAPFLHGDQGLIPQQRYRPGHLDQVRMENAGPAPMPQYMSQNGFFPPIPNNHPAHQNPLFGRDNEGRHSRQQQDHVDLNLRQPTIADDMYIEQLMAGWENVGDHVEQQQHRQNGLNFDHGHPTFALGVAHEEEVPYEFPVLPTTQQQPSTSDGSGARAKPVADISGYAKEDQELLMNIFGDCYNFSTSGPGAAPRAVSPVAVAIPPPAATPGLRQMQGPPSGSVGSIVSLTSDSPNEVTPPQRPRRMHQGPQDDDLFQLGRLAAPAAPRGMPPPRFFPPAPNMLMPSPQAQFNMQAGGNFWNPLIHHPLDYVAQLLARIKTLEEENSSLKRRLEAKDDAAPAKKRRQDQMSTSAASVTGDGRLVKIKRETVDDEDEELEQNRGFLAPRTIKKETMDPRDILPIPQAAPDADLIVLDEVRPGIRQYKSIAEAIEAAKKEFSDDYFFQKFGRFNLPIQSSFSEFFREYVFKPQVLTSLNQLPQVVKKRSTYPKTMFNALLRTNTYPANWTEEEDKWKLVFKELDKIQMEQRRAGLICWKEPRGRQKE